MTVPITLRQLEKILSTNKGAQFATITAATIPDMRKLNNPFFDRVMKLCTRNAVINASYESVVNKRMNRLVKQLQESEITPAIQQQIDTIVAELPFVAGPRQWGKRRRGTPFVDHRGKIYLEVIVLKEIRVDYILIENGSKVPLSRISRYLTKSKDRWVKLRDYEIGNIRTLTLRGQIYSIIPHRG